MADDNRTEAGLLEGGLPIENDLKAKTPSQKYAGDVAAKYGDITTAIRSGNVGASIRAAMTDYKPGKATFHYVADHPGKK